MFIEFIKDYLTHTVGKQIQTDAATAQALIAQGVAKAIADPTQNIVEKAVADAAGRLSDSFSKSIDLALKQFAEAQAKSKKNGVAAIFGEGNQGDPKKSFGDFCLGVARGDRKYLEKHYGSTFVEYSAKAALAEASGVTGGYVVPPEFYQGLLQVMEEETYFRPRAFVQPMASATLMFPYLDVTTVQAAGVPSFFGGVQMYWTEEAQSRTETEPQFKMMELKAHELSGYAVSSNVLLQDAAFGLEKYLMNLFGRAVGWFEEYAFMQGNGVGKPLGVLNCKAAILTGGNAGGTARNTASQVQYSDVITMISRLLPSSLKRAFWTVHPYVLPQLLQLRDPANRLVWVPQNGGAQNKVPGTLFGCDVIITEKVPPLGTAGDVMLIDPALYVIGDRMQIEIAASEHVNFLKNQMTWRVVERVDGQPWLDKAITLQDGTTTVSPFVVLN